MLTGGVVFLLRWSMRSALIFSVAAATSVVESAEESVEVMRHVRLFAEGQREKVTLSFRGGCYMNSDKLVALRAGVVCSGKKVGWEAAARHARMWTTKA